MGSSDSPRPESMLLMECLVRSSPCSVRNLAPPPAWGGEEEEEEEGGGACMDVDARVEVLLCRFGLLPCLL